MAAVTLEGIVRNGRIEIREQIKLAEGAKVYVIVLDSTAAPTPRIRSCIHEEGHKNREVTRWKHH